MWDEGFHQLLIQVCLVAQAACRSRVLVYTHVSFIDFLNVGANGRGKNQEIDRKLHQILTHVMFLLCF
jgi:hypothetical protein